MAQLCIYLDEKTIKKIENEAKKENVSTSQWCRDKLQLVINNKLEQKNSLKSLHGALKDCGFEAPKKLDFSKDSKREKL